MKTEDAIKQFKGAVPLARALGITPAAVYQWGDDVPRLRACHIELLIIKQQQTLQDETAEELELPKEASVQINDKAPGVSA